MSLNRKISSETLRKEIWDYTRGNPVFTSLQLKKDLNLSQDNGNKNLNVVSKFLKELVSWQYLSSQKEGTTVRYYVNL